MKPADPHPHPPMPRRGAPRQRATEVDRADRDSLFAAVLLAVFLHLLLFWGAPSSLVERADSPPPVPQTMELLLEPLPEEPEFEEQYVRAAPNIPEAAPDETRNISDRDQRAAQEESAPPDPENTPFVEGDEPESNRLVQGDPSQEPTPPTPPAASQAGGASPMPRQEAAPAEPVAQAQPDFLEQIPQTDEGPASMETPAEARERPEEPADPRDSVEVTSPADGAGEARFTTPPQSAEAQAPTPRPRPRVERDTSFGPVKDNRQGAIQIGRLAFDAEYSEFGEYWRRVAEIIEARWRNLVYNTRSIPFGGYRVVVRFAITRDGQVTDVEIAHSTAGRLAETVSVDAIVGEAPFFEWTPEMIVKMGDQARCAIHFHY